MTIQEYIESINKRFKSGFSGEHSYRSDLEVLIRNVVQGVEITNEPANVTDCGNPDYVITKGKIPIGFIEAKDIGKDIKSKQYNEQFNRYRKALDNLIITDYMYFRFFRNGELVHEIKIAEIADNEIKAITHNFVEFENLLKDFCSFIGQTIKSSKKLAEMMAAKARLLQNILERAVSSDEEKKEDSSIKAQYETFKNILIHDLTPKGFADIYAQTLAYGMFAARLHDKALANFSRQEAAELIPKTNPFLRRLFGYVAGPDIDDRIVTTVDNLADVFRATNVDALLHNFGKSTQTQDPVIHFYEDFLSEYDPKLRKSRGVWYTPEPVVSFIVRAVDDILKTEFDLPEGLADISKTKIKVQQQGNDKVIEKEVHKVQILDPATGTGTFLAEVVKFIYNKRFKPMQGVWSSYVENHLIPRLNGFELLMASYSMAHLKLDMLLTETAYKAKRDERFNIYLTNSLEEHHPDTGTIFSNWLSNEANEANRVKRDTPVMCVIGNPPYAVSSSNKGEWINELMKDYKKDLNERNIQPLSDDYIKFIRFGEHFINKNGEGILAYITNNSFIDGIIHRQMRKHLLETFDKVYILDLHGNSKKKETTPDGSPDQNVFDIMQGVSINIFVKKSKTEKLASVFHFDLYGKRDYKYNFLNNNSLNSINWNELECRKPKFYFVKKGFKAQEEYSRGFGLNVLFQNNASGITTERDAVTIHFDDEALEKIETNIVLLETEEFRNKFTPKPDGRDWKILTAKKDIKKNDKTKTNILYRPFDIRRTIYTGKSKGFHSYPRAAIMTNLIKENVSLIFERSVTIGSFTNIFVANCIVESHILGTAFSKGYTAPLYLYPDNSLFSSKRDNQKVELQYQLKQAKKQLKEVEAYYKNTVKPYYDAISEPDEDKSTLYEEHKTTFEEAKSQVESIEKQLDDRKKEVIQKPKEAPQRIPNLDMEIVEEIAEKLKLEFVAEKENPKGLPTNFAPIDILDYVYAVLHCPTYRKKYKEFLKIDFPRVPYPKNTKIFWELVKLGGELRQIHLLESPKLKEYIIRYPEGGSNKVTRKITKKDWELINEETGRIWVNDEQYFDNIPLVAWEFYIGGYQPAKKWLKDRKQRELSFADILHYQKIIVALTETNKLMTEIDKVMT